MAKDDATGTEDGEAAKPRDASLRVDTKTLSSEEQEFARMMGFAGENEATAPAPSPARPAAKTPTATPPAPTVPAVEVAPAEAPVVEDTPTETSPIAAAVEAPMVAADGAADAESEQGDPSTRDFEEIHPRAAALGRQSALLERADRVGKLAVAGGRDARSPSDAGDESATSGRARANDDAVWLERVRVRDARIAELETSTVALQRDLAQARLAPPAPMASATPSAATPTEREKDLERLQGEIEGLLQERDRLSDELAIANAARAQAQTRAERFEVALRAARGPDGPLPDGERELRAEVVGLRRRLEAASAENRGLRESLETSATDLAIARAHGDDRQQEIEQQRERITALEQERAAQVERLDEALVRQRELLALVTRVQAENVELRSTQAALEETLEARDLEINAREEHLQVTRRGLVTRDQQLLDAEERLEQARHRHAVLEAELEQQARARIQLEEKLARRDARIASLSTTLARIEQAIGRPTSAPSPEDTPPESPKPSRPSTRPSESPSDLSSSAPSATASESASASESATATAPATGPTSANASALETAATTDTGAIVPSLPPLLTRWRDGQLRTLFGDAAPASAEDFLARQLVARVGGAATSGLRLLSLGGAHVETEIRFLEALRESGVEPVSIRVLDRSTTLLEARRQAIEEAGHGDAIQVEPWSGSALDLGEPAAALLVCDALQGWSDAGAALAVASTGLAAEGVVLFADRIAGGPVTLSPETSEKLAELWQVLPESLTAHAELAHAPENGDDGGSAAPGDDGLNALLEAFAPILTVGVGHVADLFVGPARGLVLSALPEAAESLLASIDAIDESRSILESLPPRHGLAVCLRREALAADAGTEALGLPWPTPAR